MPTLICYDISATPLRTKLGKKITEGGLDRINKSVYLGTITDSSLTSLENELATLIRNHAGPGDSLIIIAVTVLQVDQMRIYGNIGPDKDELSGEKSTLIYWVKTQENCQILRLAAEFGVFLKYSRKS